MSTESKRTFPLAKVGILVVLLAATVAVGVRYGDAVVAFFSEPERLRASFASLGAWGPLVSILLSAAQVLIAPIPGQAVGLANGYLYGPYLGLALSVAGMTLGGGIAMLLARWLGRPLVEHFVDRETLDRLDRLTAHRGSLFFFLVFLVPFLPDDAACFAIGLSSLPIPRMLVLAVVGRAPGTFMACFLGAHAEDLPAWAVIASFAGAGLLGLLFARYSNRLESRAFETLERAERRLDGDGELTKGPSR